MWPGVGFVSWFVFLARTPHGGARLRISRGAMRHFHLPRTWGDTIAIHEKSLLNMPDGCVRAGAGSTCSTLRGPGEANLDYRRWGTKNPGRFHQPEEILTCPPDALVSAGSSRSRVGEIQLDGGTAIGNMKIAVAVHLLHRNHWVVLLSARERLWLAQSPTRVFISEVTRRLSRRAWIHHFMESARCQQVSCERISADPRCRNCR